MGCIGTLFQKIEYRRKANSLSILIFNGSHHWDIQLGIPTNFNHALLEGNPQFSKIRVYIMTPPKIGRGDLGHLYKCISITSKQQKTILVRNPVIFIPTNLVSLALLVSISWASVQNKPTIFSKFKNHFLVYSKHIYNIVILSTFYLFFSKIWALQTEILGCLKWPHFFKSMCLKWPLWKMYWKGPKLPNFFEEEGSKMTFHEVIGQNIGNFQRDIQILMEVLLTIFNMAFQ